MVNLSEEDKTLLEELCLQHDVRIEKILKLLSTVREYEFKDRRTGIYNVLRNIIIENPKA